MTDREAILAEVETRVRIAERQGWHNRSVPVRLLRQIAEVLAGNQGATSGIASTAASSAQKKNSHILGLMKETDADQGGTWEPSGKCQYDACDGTRFDWDSTDSRYGSWFCVKCGGMQLPPQVGCETDSAPSVQVQEKKEDSGGTSLTAGAGVSGLVPAWLPIESAPKDGSVILLAEYRQSGYSAIEHGAWEFIERSEWDGAAIWGWCTDMGRIDEPTHWMPKLTDPVIETADQPLSDDRSVSERSAKEQTINLDPPAAVQPDPLPGTGDL